jgi:hypothetical protein
MRAGTGASDVAIGPTAAVLPAAPVQSARRRAPQQPQAPAASRDADRGPHASQPTASPPVQQPGAGPAPQIGIDPGTRDAIFLALTRNTDQALTRNTDEANRQAPTEARLRIRQYALKHSAKLSGFFTRKA